MRLLLVEDDRLLAEVNQRGASASLCEGAELHQRVVGLFTAVAETREDPCLAYDCGHLLNRFVVPMSMPDSGADLEAVQTICGAISQYSDGDNSSCTSCAQAFLRSILPLGLAWGLTPDQVTGFVQMGKGLHFALLKQVQHFYEECRAELGEDFTLPQAFSVEPVVQTSSTRTIW